MKNIISERGFQFVMHPAYIGGQEKRLVSQSSAARDDAAPGCGCLWVDENHHLERTEVQELVSYLQRWLDTGNLFKREPKEQ